MTVIMMSVAPMMGVHMDIAASLAGMMHMPWAADLTAHRMLGVIVFPLVYAFVFANRLLGSLAVRESFSELFSY
jgi:uncharacterized protein (DUF2062 family)